MFPWNTYCYWNNCYHLSGHVSCICTFAWICIQWSDIKGECSILYTILFIVWHGLYLYHVKRAASLYKKCQVSSEICSTTMLFTRLSPSGVKCRSKKITVLKYIACFIEQKPDSFTLEMGFLHNLHLHLCNYVGMLNLLEN